MVKLEIVTDKVTAQVARKFADRLIYGLHEDALNVLMESHVWQAGAITWNYFNNCVDLYIDDHLYNFEQARKTRS